MSGPFTWTTLAWQRARYIAAEAYERGAILERWRENRTRLLKNAAWFREHRTWMGIAFDLGRAEDCEAAAEIWERMLAWAEAQDLARQQTLFHPTQEAKP